MTLMTRLLISVVVITAIFHAQSAAQKISSNQMNAQDDGGQKTVPLKTHSLVAPYLDSDLQSRWYVAPVTVTDVRWDFGGDTVIDANRYPTRILGKTNITDRYG